MYLTYNWKSFHFLCKIETRKIFKKMRSRISYLIRYGGCSSNIKPVSTILSLKYIYASTQSKVSDHEFMQNLRKAYFHSQNYPTCCSIWTPGRVRLKNKIRSFQVAQRWLVWELTFKKNIFYPKSEIWVQKLKCLQN